MRTGDGRRNGHGDLIGARGRLVTRLKGAMLDRGRAYAAQGERGDLARRLRIDRGRRDAG
jgi:hypothetical protein